MSLAVALRRNMLKAKARRLFVEIQSLPMRRGWGPRAAIRRAEAERKLASTMERLAEVDPRAAALIAEREGAAMTDPGLVLVRVGPADVVVQVRGVPHIILRRADVSAVESWIRNVGSLEPYYFIEFTTRNGPLTCDYKDRSLWEEILRKLAASRMFDEMQGEAQR